MDLFVNELSIHRQFAGDTAFKEALGTLLAIRREVEESRRRLLCTHHLACTHPMPDTHLKQALNRVCTRQQLTMVMRWLTQAVPGEGDRRLWHSPDDFLQCKDEVVTDTAVGEAAYRAIRGSETAVVSLVPSDWDFSPLVVRLCHGDSSLPDSQVRLENIRDVSQARELLGRLPPALDSWESLRLASEARFPCLTFGAKCFDPLRRVTFAMPVARRLFGLFGVLDGLAREFDNRGDRTPEGHRIHGAHFTGGNAAFSDSSDTEKNRFRDRMTFRHPGDPAQQLFCPFHGKVNHTPPLRFHYHWTGRAGDPVYVVYIGPKITRT